MSALRRFTAEELASHGEFFQVLETTDNLQVGLMILAPEETSGEFGTDHPQADQLLFVLEGGGSVRCEESSVDLEAGDVVLIPAGADHQVIGPNRTLSVYAPVAYPEEE
jgi:mannose-6-phosphate isomerase-like protein (cupin superfamily)